MGPDVMGAVQPRGLNVTAARSAFVRWLPLGRRIACKANGRYRRILPIAERPSQGRVAEPVADPRSWRRGLLFVPRSCRCPFVRGCCKSGPSTGAGVFSPHRSANRGLDRLKCAFGLPVLVSVSRKSFLAAITGRTSPDERGPVSLAAELYAGAHGADFIRTHDPAARATG